MIVKIKSYKRPTFRKILEYILNDDKRSTNQELSSFTITHNLKGKTIKDWDTQFLENEEHRLRKRKDSVHITHEILSWHKDDAKHLTLEAMQDMAREYINQRNPRGIYVAVPHFDKDHFHIHICASGIEYKTGKSMRLSKANLLKLKNGIQQYQVDRFPELTKSVVNHGEKSKRNLSDKEYQIKFRTGRESEKEKIIAKLNACYKKSVSKKEIFLTSLNDCGLKTYERNGKITGVKFRNYKFRFKRLGINDEMLETFDLLNYRTARIKIIRHKESGKIIER